MAWPLEPILTRFQTLALGVLVALTVVFPTLTAASLFGALGVRGVAIGFAFKDIFQNLLAGLLILITRPFRIGDQIVSGEHEGTVEDIQVRATLLHTYDNRRVVIPNSELYTNRVIVNTAY
ncbi:mechanosensitive ion channel family protein, partial [Deinococcus soli (ex Cha et al. 2016)]